MASQYQVGSSSKSRVSPSTFEEQRVAKLIDALHYPETRDYALHHLSKSMDICKNLGPMLWHSAGTITVLLQELLSIYNLLHRPYFTEKASIKVCNAVTLLQCVAEHPDTKLDFIRDHIPLYLYPFLNNTFTQRSHEFLRLTSLGVIGALVKVDDPRTVHFFLESQIIPCCLRCMEVGKEMSKIVATFIVYKILLSDEGLKFCCNIAERFFAIALALAKMIEMLAESGVLDDDSKWLLKHIIWCYLRLSESPRAHDGLRCCLPMSLRDSTFTIILSNDQTTKECLQQLFENIATAHQPRTQQVVELPGRQITGLFGY